MAGHSQTEIKRRIRSVRNTQHITRAMQIVSAVKLRRVQGLIDAVTPYAEKLEELLSAVVGVGQHPLLQEREIQRVRYVVIAMDHGLTGGYSANLTDWVTRVLRQEQRPFDLWVLGRKGADLLQAHGIVPDTVYGEVGDDIDWPDVRQLAGRLRDSFLSGDVDAVNLLYMHFVNTMVHRPTLRRLLPAEISQGPRSEEYTTIFEPSPLEVFNRLMPRYIDVLLYTVLLNATCSEHGARMVAMRQATDNAEEIIETLTLGLNRARQAGITLEISEIVGGANALAEDAND